MNSEKNKILIADGDTYIHSLLDAVFPAREFEIISAKSGSEAAALLKVKTPDAIILDARLPILDGIDLCGRVKRIKRFFNTVVVVMTPAEEPMLADAARIARADAVVPKPLNAQAFKTMVVDLMHRRMVSAPVEELV